MGADHRVVTLLESIDASLKRLVALANAGGSAHGAASSGAVASDRDLDSQYGNPEVRFMPRDWSGPSMKGRKFSECPAEFLDLIAESFEYFGRKADETGETTNSGKPVGDYKRKDAARARGWAARIRSGRHTPKVADADAGWDEPSDGGWGAAPADDAPTVDDIPF